MITEGEKRLESVLGTDEGWKDACQSTGIERRCFVGLDAEGNTSEGGRKTERVKDR